jgi:hypothetical protein
MFPDAVLKAFSSYPIIEGAVALLILYGGYKAINAGRKDGPQPPYPSTFSHEYPAWLMSGPVHDTMVHIASIKHEMVRCRELLTEIERHGTRQIQILEMIQNENIINPRRLRE